MKKKPKKQAQQEAPKKQAEQELLKKKAPPKANKIHPLKIENNKLAERLKDTEKQFLYLKAEFENYKKQQAIERQQLMRYSGDRFIRALAEEVIDDFERAFDSYIQKESLEDFKKGMDLIYKKLQKTLEDFGIQSLDPKGEPFDPNSQQVLSKQKNSSVPAGHVLTTFKKIYKLHDKIIRLGYVVLSDGPEESQDTEEG